MRRPLLLLVAIALLGALVPAVIMAEPAKVPHEDPAKLELQVDRASLLLAYADTFDLAALGRYLEAWRRLNSLDRVELSAELRKRFDDYDQVSRRLVEDLDRGEARLTESAHLVEQGRGVEAKVSLDDAMLELASADTRQKTLATATDTIGQELAIKEESPGSELALASDRLNEGVRSLRRLIDAGLLPRARERTSEYDRTVTGLVPTELSLAVSPAAAFVGDEVVASGRLTSLGAPLGRKSVTVYLDSSAIDLITLADGSYRAFVKLPYRYVSNMSVYSQHSPSEPDLARYQGSRSPGQVIGTRFYADSPVVSVPLEAFPGKAIQIVGDVGSSGPALERTVTVLLDGSPITEVRAAASFTLDFTVPLATRPGRHTLSARVSPYQRYAGGSVSTSLEVRRLPVEAEVSAPAFLVFPGSAAVSGRLHDGGTPIAGAAVTVRVSKWSTGTVTAPDGSFSASLDLPVDFWPVSRSTLSVNARPVEPWYSPLEERRHPFGVGVFGLILALLATASIVLLVRWVGSRRPLEPSPAPLTVPPVAPVPELAGMRDKILWAYTSGVQTVQKATPARMAPHTTLREFLGAACPVLPAAAKALAELTFIAECALYAGAMPGEPAVQRAERLARAIEEELGHGAG